MCGGLVAGKGRWLLGAPPPPQHVHTPHLPAPAQEEHREELKALRGKETEEEGDRWAGGQAGRAVQGSLSVWRCRQAGRQAGTSPPETSPDAHPTPPCCAALCHSGPMVINGASLPESLLEALGMPSGGAGFQIKLVRSGAPRGCCLPRPAGVLACLQAPPACMLHRVAAQAAAECPPDACACCCPALPAPAGPGPRGISIDDIAEAGGEGDDSDRSGATFVSGEGGGSMGRACAPLLLHRLPTAAWPIAASSPACAVPLLPAQVELVQGDPDAEEEGEEEEGAGKGSASEGEEGGYAGGGAAAAERNNTKRKREDKAMDVDAGGWGGVQGGGGGVRLWGVAAGCWQLNRAALGEGECVCGGGACVCMRSRAPPPRPLPVPQTRRPRAARSSSSSSSSGSSSRAAAAATMQRREMRRRRRGSARQTR